MDYYELIYFRNINKIKPALFWHTHIHVCVHALLVSPTIYSTHHFYYVHFTCTCCTLILIDLTSKYVYMYMYLHFYLYYHHWSPHCNLMTDKVTSQQSSLPEPAWPVRLPWRPTRHPPTTSGLDLSYILLQRVGHVTERMLLIGCLNGWGWGRVGGDHTLTNH